MGTTSRHNNNSTHQLQLMASPDQQGPIRLEISLSQSNSFNSDTKEMSVQTDLRGVTSDQRLHAHHDSSSASDANTEYIPLPIPNSERTRRNYKQQQQRLSAEQQQTTGKGRQQQQRSNNNKKATAPSNNSKNDQVYAKYARQDSVGGGGGGGGGAPKKINSKEKPKWGVGPKKKEYKPASQRYVNGRQWKEKRELNMRRREEQLLQQQVANERNYYQSNMTS